MKQNLDEALSLMLGTKQGAAAFCTLDEFKRLLTSLAFNYAGNYIMNGEKAIGSKEDVAAQLYLLNQIVTTIDRAEGQDGRKDKRIACFH